MKKPDLGYYTLEEAAERWLCTVYKIIEWGANGILKICETKEIRQARSMKIGNKLSPKHLSSHHFDTILENISPYNSEGLLIGTDLSITKEEFCRFELEQNIHVKTEEDYPPELRIATEVWDKVFAHGLTPQNPPLSQHDMVRDALRPYKLEDGVERICYIVTVERSKSKVTEFTFPEHQRNEEGHPHHAPLLEIAIKLWEACRDLDPYKAGAKTWLEIFHKTLGVNESKAILELTNPKPKGGRPKKGA